MTGVITPWIRTVFTDVFGPIMSFQSHPLCASRELEIVDCLEAYGTINGKTKCRVLIEDFRECILQAKQNHRVKIMKIERERQYNAGERSEENLYAPSPRNDSY